MDAPRKQDRPFTRRHVVWFQNCGVDPNYCHAGSPLNLTDKLSRNCGHTISYLNPDQVHGPELPLERVILFSFKAGLREDHDEHHSYKAP